MITKPPYRSVGKTKLKITRRPYPTYVKGVLVEGTPQIVTLLVNIQPLTKSNGVQITPEETTAKRKVILWTNSEVYQKEDHKRVFQADRFEWQGELYEIDRAICWKMGVLDHWEATAVVVDPE